MHSKSSNCDDYKTDLLYFSNKGWLGLNDSQNYKMYNDNYYVQVMLSLRECIDL